MVSNTVSICHSLRGSVDWNILHDLSDKLIWSLPSWECGLKLFFSSTDWVHLPSLPSWECGLKSDQYIRYGELVHVTPFVGVWIEILLSDNLLVTSQSLPSWECGLKYVLIWCIVHPAFCHSLRGSVDWNISSQLLHGRLTGHSLRGSVD